MLRSVFFTVKIIKRIFVGFLLLLVLAQIPFIYRRYQTGKLAEKIAQAESQRSVQEHPQYKEYKGIIHAHTNLGGHSTGTFEELIAAANANDLDFVLMTEHVTDTFDSAAQTMNGVYGKTLFVGGNELDTTDGDRFLLIPGGGEAVKARMSGTQAFLEQAKAENKLAFVTYPEKFKSWDAPFDGIEVFSLHTAAKQMNPLTALGDLIWTYPAYPELMLAQSFKRPDANLAKFDEIAAQRKISLFAGTDAHSNIGFHLFGDDSGNRLINIKLDPYENIFRITRIHVRLPAESEFNVENLLGAIREGSFFVGMDAIGDSSGFVFDVIVEAPIVLADESQAERLSGIGVMSVKATIPMPARLVIYKNGETFIEARGTSASHVGRKQPGVYRVEVYRDDLGPPFDKMPWIISNPIYVK